MSRHQLILPDIDYGQDEAFQFPGISNIYNQSILPDKFHRWGSQNDNPLHCFVDDWRIEAIWRHRFKMVDKVILSGFAVLPDFTVETDTPLIHAVYQVWRSRVIGRYWQDHGVNVIPALQWSRPSINPHLFADLDQCDIVAVRSPTRGSEAEWIQCAEQFLSFHQPKLVLHFGTRRGLQVWPRAINLNLR